MSIKIITGFDGASPYSDAGVKRVSDDRATVFPSLRRQPGNSEEAVGAGSRFNIRLLNPTSRKQVFSVTADWETAVRVKGHDLGYQRFGADGTWQMIPGVRIDDTQIAYTLELPPGITALSLFPEFNYADCRTFVETCAARGAQTEIIGQSREKRDIWMLSFPSDNPQAAAFFLQARDHAYETAGSFCVLGIVDFLLGGSPLARYLRSKFNVSIVPMTNPDGVYNGMSRLTWEQGADMNRINTVPDSAHTALKAALDKVRPVVHMNIHNWISKFEDGLLANDESAALKILGHMPPDSAHFKHWKVQTTADFIKADGWDKLSKDAVAARRAEVWSWKNYCQENFNAIGVNFEFPWFNLGTREMRTKGVRAFAALALTAIEEQNL